MFSWICPQCGHEVPPSYNECPNCATKDAPAAAPQQTPAAPAPAPPSVAATVAAPPAAEAPAPPQQYAPPQYAPQQYMYPPRRRAPAWLVTLGVALAFVAVGGAAYYYLLPSERARREAAQGSSGGAPVLEPASAAGPAAATGGNAMSKYVEVTGVRVLEDQKKAQVKFVVVNHSSAEMANLEGTLVLHASNAAQGSEPLGSADFKVASLGANDSVDVTTPLKTRLRAYELPDWQFVRVEVGLKGSSGR